MKIIYISEFFPSNRYRDVHGGVEMRTYYAAREAAKMHTVVVITSRNLGQPRSTLLDNIKIQRVGIPYDYTRKGNCIPRLLFLFGAVWESLPISAQIVEGCGFMGWLPAYVLKKIKAIKAIILIPDVLTGYAKQLPKMTRLLVTVYEKFIFTRKWDQIIVISKEVKRKLLQQGISNNKIAVIYCGVDIKHIRTIKAVKFKTPTAVVVSRLVPYKKVDVFINALDIISKTTIIRGIIIGDGEEFNRLSELVIRLNLKNHIHFMRFVPNHDLVIKTLKKSDVYCLPSVIEGFGIATVEAFACALPAIVCDLPINHEITHDKGVLFFQKNDSMDLARKMTLLLSNKKKYRNLSSNAEKIAQKYSLDKINAPLFKIYENLLTD